MNYEILIRELWPVRWAPGLRNKIRQAIKDLRAQRQNPCGYCGSTRPQEGWECVDCGGI